MEDPMRKREQFAVSLRKQKTKDIIAHKRRRLLDSVAEKSEVCMMSSSINADRSLPEYSGFYKFNKDN
jgi:Zn-dependent peptidase ImmA (M78 family)